MYVVLISVAHLLRFSILERAIIVRSKYTLLVYQAVGDYKFPAKTLKEEFYFQSLDFHIKSACFSKEAGKSTKCWKVLSKRRWSLGKEHVFPYLTKLSRC